MKRLHLTCQHCHHEWTPADPKDAIASLRAAEVNVGGPFCDLCRHLEMARRFAQRRHYTMLSEQLAENLRILAK